MKKLLIASILLWASVAAIAQPVDTTANRIRVRTAPSGACTAGQVAQTAAGEIYSCISGTWGLSGSVSITDATATVKGKATLGQTAVVATASLGTCAAGNVGQIKRVTDGNKGTRVCTNTTGSTYAWVDPSGGRINARDFGIDGTAGDKSTELNAIIALVNAGTYNRVLLPPGYVDVYSTLTTITNDKLILEGDSNRATEIRIYHNGVGITYTPTTADLNEAKPTFQNFSMLCMQNGGDAVKSTTGSGWVGTAIKTNGGYGMTMRNLHIRNFSKGLHLKDTAVNVFENINVRNCYWGLYSEGWSNTNTFLGGVFSRASVNTGEDWPFESTTVKGTDYVFIGTDFEPGSQTNKIGNRNKFLNCRIEQLHLDTYPTFFVWFDIQGDGNVFEDCDYYFGGASLPSSVETEFFFDVTGDNNKFNFRRLFRHDKWIRINADSSNNEVEFSTKYDDYTLGASYLGSNRFIRDNGVGNRVTIKSQEGSFERVTSVGFRDSGVLTSLLPQASQASLTLTRLTQDVSNITGPFGIPAASFYQKKYTVSSTDPSGAFARTSTITLGTGSQTYTTTAYVYMHSSFQSGKKVCVGNIAATSATDCVYADSDGKSRWLPITQYYTPDSSTYIQPTIFTNADSGNIFYVAFLSTLKGVAPAVAIPPASAQTYAESTILGRSSHGIWESTVPGSLYVGTGTGGVSDAQLEVGDTSLGGRISATDGGGSSRRALVFNSPTSGAAYARLFAYNYGGSAALPLALNDPGGNVYVGKTTGTEALDVNGSIKASNYSYALKGMFGTYSSIRGEDVEVAQTTGGRIVSTDGQGSSSRALVMSSGYSAQAYARLFAYNYGGSAGMVLALNDPGGNVVVGATSGSEKLTVAGNISATSTSANALAVGANGTTNPVLKVDASTGSVATGIGVTGAAAGSGVAVAAISSGSNENLTLAGKGTGAVRFLSPLNFTSLAFSTTAPTVTSAGTSPSIVASNGTAAFTINVGTGGTATTIVLAMPAATTGWICHATNVTATAANRADQAVRLTASTTTSVTLQNQTVSTGAALAFTASDVVHCQCTAY